MLQLTAVTFLNVLISSQEPVDIVTGVTEKQCLSVAEKLGFQGSNMQKVIQSYWTFFMLLTFLCTYTVVDILLIWFIVKIVLNMHLPFGSTDSCYYM